MRYRVYEPTPKSQKSFYGKCSVHVAEDGRKALRSYKTIVLTEDADGHLHRHWSGWSATTARHVWAAFGIDTKAYRKMEVEELPSEWRELQETF